VVLAGGMHLAGYATGPTSPFNIARRVQVLPLSDEQSRALVLATLRVCDVPASRSGLNRLVAWTGGDYWLLPWLTTRAGEAASRRRRRLVTGPLVDQLARECLEDEEARAPLREALQIIEEDPDSILDVLQLLDQGWLHRTSARQPVTRTGIDRLQLSGAVVFADRVYHVKNLAYQVALSRYFTPGHASRVLRMNGRWRDAIGYLAPLVTVGAQPDARTDLLEAIVQSIYASDRLDEAYAALAQGLRSGFQLEQVAFYTADRAHNELRLMYTAGGARSVSERILLSDQDRVEVQAYKSANFALRRGEHARRLVAALVASRRAIGVVSIEGYLTDLEKPRLPSDLPTLLHFLRHAAAAIENVSVRGAYQEIGQAVLDARETALTLRRVLDSAINVLGCSFAVLYLLDAVAGRLDAITWSGSSDLASVDMVQSCEFGSSDPVARTLAGLEPVVVGAHDASAMIVAGEWLRSDPGLRVLLPLRAGGTALGVLAIGYLGDQRFAIGPVQKSRMMGFGSQVAIAVHNAHLLQRMDAALGRRVDELGMLLKISRIVSSTLDLGTVLERVLQGVHELFPTTEATIWRYESVQDRLVLLHTSLADPDYRSMPTAYAGVAGKVVHGGAPVYLRDLADEHHDRLRALGLRLGLHSMLSLPLSSHQRILGALEVFTRAGDALAEGDHELLAAFAAQAALAIDNAEAYQRLQAEGQLVEELRQREMLYLTNHVLLHRLGNAVGDIPFHLNRLREETAGGREVEETLVHIESRVNNIIALLQPYKRLVALKNMVREPLDLCSVVEEAAALAIPGLENDVNLSERPLRVQGNRTLLRDAIQCVIENAWEAMEKRVAPTIEVGKRDAGHAVVSIKDRGPGILQAIAPRIFELGYSTKKADSHERGHGLFLAQAVAREHGGQISFENDPSGGAIFRIVLPIG
jgi:signal transduction histidine kinase